MGVIGDSWALGELNRKINKYERKLRQIENKKTQMGTDITDLDQSISDFKSVSSSSDTYNIEGFGEHGVKYCNKENYK